ncbi:MAG: hypothetical protein ACYTGQ_15440 [Planctomycetota bacterium]|jgi:hypothetical protein
MHVKILLTLCLMLAPTALAPAQQANTRLAPWARGINVRIADQPDMKAWFWFYEWNMFDAVEPGQHTGGTFLGNDIRVNDAQTKGSVTVSPDLKVEVTAAPDGAELLLTIRNHSRHDWPRLASIIPCFNPGPQNQRNPQFTNEDTWFLAPEGLTKTIKRQIHFNRNLRMAVDAEADPDNPRGPYVWTEKWPKTDPNATAGLLLRRSNDKRWVMAIAWERFLSVQAHNPWLCMHQGIHIGPLKRGETRTVRGRIYLMKGTPEQVVARYRKDFPGN